MGGQKLLKERPVWTFLRNCITGTSSLDVSTELYHRNVQFGRFYGIVSQERPVWTFLRNCITGTSSLDVPTELYHRNLQFGRFYGIVSQGICYSKTFESLLFCKKILVLFKFSIDINSFSGSNLNLFTPTITFPLCRFFTFSA